MNKNNPNNSDLWVFRVARNATIRERFILIVLIISAVLAVFRLANWWFREIHVSSLPVYILLSCVFWYAMARLILIWVNYLNVRKPKTPPAPKGYTVAIYTTSSPGEPLSMFEKTLEACQNIDYPHTTYLLDDTRNPEFKALAEKYGVVWLELVGIPGAKAGKINAAMKLTTEEIILVLDPDHIPFPNFFEEVLGFFQDSKVGFVQVAQAYYNQYRSFTALGAAEQTYGFYGPTQMGLFGKNCSVAIGSNCTFRRKALESAGGHGIGLAEDLITSIRIHAQGWKSIYNPVVVSRGLVPEDFGSFCKQQLKWARGVFEVVFEELPRLFTKLSFWQKLSYSTIGTYYLAGTSMLVYILIPFMYFFFGVLPAEMAFKDFVSNGLPVLILSVLIYLYVQIWLCHPKVERGLHWRGMFLKFACWPVFFMGFVLSLINKDIPYIPTAKQAVIGKVSPFVKPLIAQIILFFLAVAYVVITRKYVLSETILVMTSEKTWGMIGFATMATFMAFGGLYAVYDSNRMTVEDPWSKINVQEIGKSKSEK